MIFNRKKHVTNANDMPDESKSSLSVDAYLQRLSTPGLDKVQKDYIKMFRKLPKEAQEKALRDTMAEIGEKFLITVKQQDDLKDKKKLNIFMGLSPLLAVGLIQIEFGTLYALGVYHHSEQYHDLVLRTSSTLVGLLLATQAFLLVARDIKTLNELKHKNTWVIGEWCSFYGIISFLAATVVSYYDVIAPSEAILPWWIEQTAFMTGLFYITALIFAIRSTFKYL